MYSQKKIHLLIPMAGKGTRFKNAGYKEIKPGILINERTMIERVLSLFPKEWKVTCILSADQENSQLVKTLTNLLRDREANILYIPINDHGPSLALQAALPTVNETDGIFVSYCDYGMIWDPELFLEQVEANKADACVISYKGFHPHYLLNHNYAFVRMKDGLIKEVREKEHFTENYEDEFASSGGYYFDSKKILEESLNYQIEKDLKKNGEFYTSLTIEALIQLNPKARVTNFEIPFFFQWGTPEDVAVFEYWEKTYNEKNELHLHNIKMDQLMIPMAGMGKRFWTLTPEKKPLIEIDGERMYSKALKYLPNAELKILVTLKDIKLSIQDDMDPSIKFKLLDSTPNGQALTIDLGISQANLDQEIFVSAVDHRMVINQQTWEAKENFEKLETVDAWVFAVKNYPGALRNPNSYTYIEIDEKDYSPFPAVKNISLKKPPHGSVKNQYLLVGSFWFLKASYLSTGIVHLKKVHASSGEELYLDHIFNYLIEQKLNIRVFPITGFINWGDPDSLNESEYWRKAFLNQ